MPNHPPFVDQILGTGSWIDAENYWEFSLQLSSGDVVRATVTPEDNRVHLSSDEMEESRKCIRWIRDNEGEVRQYVADEMYDLMVDWHDPEWGSALTNEQFRDKLKLIGISVLEDHYASVIFDDAGCFGGHAIVFSVGADGKLEDEPELWG